MTLVELDVDGMTCAACPAREKSTVRFDQSKLAVEKLLDRIRDTGYGAQVAREGEIRDHSAELAKARTDFLIAAVLTAPFLVEMASMFTLGHGWLPGTLQWLVATPVQLWSGRRFYRGAWNALRGGTANMDVLVALGTSVAYFFSTAVLFFKLDSHLYFEAGAVVITLVLLGKYLEARAKAKAAQSLEGLIRLQPKSIR